jgi:glycopeptide antibiotics resistance protein
MRHSSERLTAPLWSGILASGLGLLMEILQGVLSYYGYAQRAFDLHDAFANLLGAAAATILLFIRAMHPPHPSNTPKKRHPRIFFTRYVISKSASCAKVLDVTQ